MTNKEKIRKEVERLRNLHQMKYQQLDLDADSSLSLVECGKRNLCNELLSFIDSLQEEPVSEELEEAATQLSQKYFPDEENIWARPNIEAQKCKSACIEIVEWLKAQKGEEV